MTSLSPATPRLTVADIFELDKIYVPVHLNLVHWVLVVVEMQCRRITFHDSMHRPGQGASHLQSIFRYIQDEHRDKRQCPMPGVSEWQLVECTTATTPQQNNGKCCGNPANKKIVGPASCDQFPPYSYVLSVMAGSDCGVFLCMFAECISRGYPLVLCQVHVDNYRKRIALALVDRALKA